MTFCVTFYGALDENGTGSVEADVYLMTTKQYQRYEQAHSNAHSSYGWWDDIDDLLADRAELRLRPHGLTTYRDVHAYEAVNEVSFSLSLDKAEVSRLVQRREWEDFYLVIDAWDNGHGGDAATPNSALYADVAAVAARVLSSCHRQALRLCSSCCSGAWWRAGRHSTPLLKRGAE